MQGRFAGLSALRAPSSLPWIYPLILFQCLVQVNVIVIRPIWQRFRLWRLSGIFPWFRDAGHSKVPSQQTNYRKGMDLTRRDYNKSASQRFGFYGLRWWWRGHVQNTKFQTESQKLLSGQRLKFCFERSIQTLSTLSFSATLSTSCMMGLLLQQQKSRFMSEVSFNWEHPLLWRRSKNYCCASLRLPVSDFLENGSVVKAAGLETRSTKLAGLQIVRGRQSRLWASSATATKAGQQTRARKPQ